MPDIKVDLGKRSYSIVVGSDISDSLASKLKRLVGGNRLYVIYDAQVYALYGKELARLFAKAARPVEFVIPSGERSKSVLQLNRIYDFLISENISRDDLIVACGGGVISDLVGYAAATTLRGIRWAVVSTTLLGMVDASIGGKTSINHSDGKNLIGAFWQPSLVWCDTKFLMTLCERELMSGLGEVLKYVGLAGKPMVDNFDKFFESGDLHSTKQLERLIVSSARYKASIVSADETDTGKRMVLNLGHTFGHAIEHGAGYGRMSHGEAVVIGLKAACHLSTESKVAGKSSLKYYQEIIDAYIDGVPRWKIYLNKVFDALALDKKRSSKRQKYILLKGLGKPIIASEIEKKVVRESLLQALTCFEFVGE